MKIKLHSYLMKRAPRLPVGLSIAVLFIALVVLAGWITNTSSLTSFTPYWSSMKPATAFSLILLSTTIILMRVKKVNRYSFNLALLPSMAVAIAALSILHYFFFGGNSIPLLLSAGNEVPVLTMSLTSAINILLTGAAIIGCIRPERNHLLCQLAALVAGLLASITLLANFYGTAPRSLFGNLDLSSLPSAVSVELLVIAILLQYPNEGVMKQVTSQTVGGRLFRTAFPVVLLLLVLVGKFRFEESVVRVYNTEVGVAFITLLVLVVFSILLYVATIGLTRLEHNLNQKDNHLRLLFDSTYLGLLIIDRHFKITEFNKLIHSYASLVIGAHLAKNQNLLDLLQGERRVILEQRLQAVFKGETISYETSYPDKPGCPVYLTVIKPVFNHLGDIVGGCLSAEDATERKKAERQNALLASVVQSSNDAIFSRDLNGVINTWNRGAERMFGHQAVDILGKHSALLVPDDQHAEEEELMHKVNLGECVGNHETHRLRKDGTMIPVSLTVSPIRDKEGWVIGSSTICTDMTAFKKTEEELKEIQWLLAPEDFLQPEFLPVYGDITRLNTERTILDAVGLETLENIVNDFMKMLGTSSAVYEKNGDYAMGIFSSGWCRAMDQASYRLCATDNVSEALGCGKWHCHESCWKEASKPSMDTKQPNDISCAGGIRLYALPILARGEVIGSINFGYGDPPTDYGKLTELAGKYELDRGHLQQLSRNYKKRPQFIIDYAKTKLKDAAELIGLMVERKWAADALIESEKDVRDLAESMPQIVWVCNPDGANVYFNQQWVDYTGLTMEESYGAGWNKPFHPDDAPLAWDAWANAVNNLAEYSLECRLRKYDGSYHWWLIRGVPKIGANGEILKWYGTCTDIDKIKSAQDEIKHLNEGLEQKVKERTQQYETVNKELEAFTYTVAHDLRSPLRAVNSYANILEQEQEELLTPDGKVVLNSIKYNIIKMARLIDELLAFSSLGRKEIKKIEVDMNEVMQNVMKEVNQTITHHADIRIQNLPVVHAENILMQQVLFNLMDNAIKYSSKKERPVIEVVSKEENGRFTIEVKDNGAGFDMRYSNKLFGVFNRLHSEKEFEGNGMGLAIVRRIVEKWGGTVGAEGKENEGARFYFTVN